MCQCRSTRSCLSSSASPSLVGAPYLNDIQGFPDPGSYEELTGSGCRLNVRHSVQRRAPATEALTDATEVGREIEEFFAGRLAATATAGISREQLVIDPGPFGPFPEPAGVSPATVATELYAAWHGADYPGTHDVGTPHDALTVFYARETAEGGA
ncbi:dihydropteroate synthase [Streptomyces sp. Tue6028]|uniref:dihydropteroate synthase n=1 Tax=Streptomyces sp. Tue6028 TaxID=2036037 RepID=UPI003D70415B